jgi:hypothetical protein
VKPPPRRSRSCSLISSRAHGCGGERLPDAIVYETFTEGFDTPDLAEARAVLDEVGARVT